jgi:hypothetical protein
MAVVHRASASTNVASRTSLTITKPAGVVAGDVLVAYIMFIGGAPTAPSGWTLQASFGSDEGVYSKVAGSSEPASYAWTIGGSAQQSGGGISAFSGVDNTSPWDVAPTFAALFANSHSITTLSANAMVVGGDEAGASGNITPPTGFTEFWENTGAPHQEMAGAIQAAPGASGTKTWTNPSASNNYVWLGALHDANAAQTVSSPAFVDTSTQVFQPAVIGNAAIVAGFVPSSAAVFTPTVSVTAGPQTVTPSFVDSSAQVFQPRLTMSGTIARVHAAHQAAINVVVDHEPL